MLWVPHAGSCPVHDNTEHHCLRRVHSSELVAQRGPLTDENFQPVLEVAEPLMPFLGRWIAVNKHRTMNKHSINLLLSRKWQELMVKEGIVVKLSVK